MGKGERVDEGCLDPGVLERDAESCVDRVANGGGQRAREWLEGVGEAILETGLHIERVDDLGADPGADRLDDGGVRHDALDERAESVGVESDLVRPDADGRHDDR